MRYLLVLFVLMGCGPSAAEQQRLAILRAQAAQNIYQSCQADCAAERARCVNSVSDETLAALRWSRAMLVSVCDSDFRPQACEATCRGQAAMVYAPPPAPAAPNVWGAVIDGAVQNADQRRARFNEMQQHQQLDQIQQQLWQQRRY
jgi:hypothetical protein